MPQVFAECFQGCLAPFKITPVNQFPLVCLTLKFKK